jgi:hypothetical protein
MVANGGWGGLSDQFITIPLFKDSAFHQESILSIEENSPAPSNFIQYYAALQLIFFDQSLAIDQDKPFTGSFRIDQHGDPDFRKRIPHALG